MDIRLEKLVVAGLLLAVSGCYRELPPVSPSTTPLDPQTEQAQADTVMSLLSSSDREALDSAFERMYGYSYRRRTEVRQVSADTSVVARKTTNVAVSTVDGERRLRVLSTDSSGAFSTGLFGWFAERAVPSEDTTALATMIMPEEPPYLKARGREAYYYRMLPDSAAEDAVFRRCLIEARPGAGDSQQIRRIRITVESSTKRIVAVHVTYDQQTLFYRERSSVGLTLKRVGNRENWLPARLALDTDVGSAFMPRKRFVAESTFDTFRRDLR